MAVRWCGCLSMQTRAGLLRLSPLGDLVPRMLDCEELSVPDVKLFRPKKWGDERGFFSETFKASAFRAAGLEVAFVQDNHSFSRQAGVLRGLHFQVPPRAQGKLVRVTRGAVFDVVVDMRVGSPSYGLHVSAVLSAENWTQLYAPPGFAHGFLTIEPDTEVLYKTTDEYAPEFEAGVVWDDPALAIPWPTAPTNLKDRDAAWPRFADIDSPFRYEF